jgi:DNA-binding phage protein
MSTTTLTTFDVADYLDSDAAIAEYLSQVLSDGDSEEFLRPSAKPRFDTAMLAMMAGLEQCFVVLLLGYGIVMSFATLPIAYWML